MASVLLEFDVDSDVEVEVEETPYVPGFEEESL
jgi:hypothetical protein